MEVKRELHLSATHHRHAWGYPRQAVLMKPFRPKTGVTSKLGQPQSALTPLNDRKAKRNGSWGRTSRAYRKANPICECCGKRASEEVHHITPLSIDNSKENMLGWDGLEALCHECHAGRHASE